MPLTPPRSENVDGPPRITFAIAVFDELQWLRAALIHLLQSGFEPRQLLLLADLNAFNGDLQSEWVGDGDYTLNGAATWIGRNGQKAPISLDIEESEKDGQFSAAIQNLAENFSNWLMPSHAKELDQHLANGGGALFVSVLDDDLVAESCQVLLRYASRNVQTHQVKL